MLEVCNFQFLLSDSIYTLCFQFRPNTIKSIPLEITDFMLSNSTFPNFHTTGNQEVINITPRKMWEGGYLLSFLIIHKNSITFMVIFLNPIFTMIPNHHDTTSLYKVPKVLYAATRKHTLAILPE